MESTKNRPVVYIAECLLLVDVLENFHTDKIKSQVVDYIQ